ncbi:MAG: hypothetical protein KQH63_04145 [Desulfobulbaceae bacterium]|nr:hypothetical protein [Desulfobulbaceae bacterium]
MNIPKPINRLIGQAMHAYSMLSDGDSVLVAVSGGIDSLVLTGILNHWQKKAPISYELSAVHLDMGFDAGQTAQFAAEQLAKLGITLDIIQTTFGKDALLSGSEKNACFHCARNRRTKLFSLAKERNCNKLALGHHKEDIIETFFLNILYSGNISTMVPNQSLFAGNLSVIRPLAFLDKAQIKRQAAIFELEAADNPCPFSNNSKRDSVRELLNTLYNSDEKIKGNIFAALSNVRLDYLLKQNKGQ